MKRLSLFAAILCVGTGCSESGIDLENARMLLLNDLASDGCSWHLQVISGDNATVFAPSDDSMQKIEEVKNLSGLTTLLLIFRCR